MRLAKKWRFSVAEKGSFDWYQFRSMSDAIGNAADQAVIENDIFSPFCAAKVCIVNDMTKYFCKNLSIFCIVVAFCFSL